MVLELGVITQGEDNKTTATYTSTSTATTVAPETSSPSSTVTNNNQTATTKQTAPTTGVLTSTTTVTIPGSAGNTTTGVIPVSTTTTITNPGIANGTTTAGITITVTTPRPGSTYNNNATSTTIAGATGSPGFSVTDTNLTSIATIPTAKSNTSDNTPTTSLTTTSTLTTSTTPSTTTKASPKMAVVLSETNILLASNNWFIELSGPAITNLGGLTVAVFNGTSSTNNQLFNKSFTTEAIDMDQVFVLDVGEIKLNEVKAALVVLFKPDTFSGIYNTILVQDQILVVTAVDGVSPSLKETLCDPPLLLMDSNVAQNKSLSLTRCSDTPNSFDSFMLRLSSHGKYNNCTLQRSTELYSLKMTFSTPTTCKGINKNNISSIFIENLNRVCLCGVTLRLIEGNFSCQFQSLYLDFYFQSSYNGQEDDFRPAFNTFVSSKKVNVGTDELHIENCTISSLCHSINPHTLPVKDDDIKITVAVVLSCVAAFLLLLIGVIFYMRRKRHGILRQFRMTRLQEDDDMEDMDNFVGGGFDQEEPRFNARNS